MEVPRNGSIVVSGTRDRAERVVGRGQRRVNQTDLER